MLIFKMGSLVFYVSKIANQTLIKGVKRPDDALFHLILGNDQLLSYHPVCLHQKLQKCRGKRSKAIELTEAEYAVYVQQGRFCFRGNYLKSGMSSFDAFSFYLSFCFSIILSFST